MFIEKVYIEICGPNIHMQWMNFAISNSLFLLKKNMWESKHVESVNTSDFARETALPYFNSHIPNALTEWCMVHVSRFAKCHLISRVMMQVVHWWRVEMFEYAALCARSNRLWGPLCIASLECDLTSRRIRIAFGSTFSSRNHRTIFVWGRALQFCFTLPLFS